MSATLSPSPTASPAPKQAQAQKNTKHEDFVGLLRRLLAEGMGTFALTLAAAGGEVIAAVSHGEVSHAARAVAPGLVVMALIYAIGDCSGAHLNPGVTLAFALRGDFPMRWMPGYWAAQILGAVGAAALLKALFGPVAHLGATGPRHGVLSALVMEIVLTWLLVTVILGTATRYSLVGPNAALAVGATIALCGLFAGPVSGASMNTARSLGPMLVTRQMKFAWVYVAGPFAGSLLALALTWVLHGGQKGQPEKEAATGKGD